MMYVKGPTVSQQKYALFLCSFLPSSCRGRTQRPLFTMWAWMGFMLTRSANGCCSSKEQLTSLCSPDRDVLAFLAWWHKAGNKSIWIVHLSKSWGSWTVTWIVLLSPSASLPSQCFSSPRGSATVLTLKIMLFLGNESHPMATTSQDPSFLSAREAWGRLPTFFDGTAHAESLDYSF